MKPIDRAVARRADYDVRAVPHRCAAELVREHHYARGAANTSVAAFGLFRRSDGAMVGASLWMPPTRVAAESVSPDWRNVLALSRLVVLPGEPQNAAGILLSRSIALLPPRWSTLLTYADSRQGHTGTIYRATNWREDLRPRRSDPVFVDATGRQVSRKMAARSRTRAEMVSLGYTYLPPLPKLKFTFQRGRKA